MKKHKDKIVLALMTIWICVSLIAISIVGTIIIDKSILLAMLFVPLSIALSIIPFLIFIERLDNKLQNQLK